MTTTSTTTPDLAALASTARAAQQGWSNRSVHERLHPVRMLRRLLVREADSLAEVIAREVGKTPTEALGGEVLSFADACRFLEREAASLLGHRRVPSRLRPVWLMGQTDLVHRRPRGIVGIVGTWNYPLFLNGVQLVQALVAGNGVLWKPSEVTPQFAEQLHAVLLESGFPADLVQRLPATREMGPALADAPVDHIVFTGSAAVGRRLAAHLGGRLVSSTLELSGCDVQLVLADADVKLAAKAAWFGATLNRGQTCIAVRRAFVHRSLYPAFCDLLGQFGRSAPRCQLVLPNEARQASELIDDAVRSGATVLAGEERLGDGAFSPVIVKDAHPAMRLCREASFAPVLAVLPFDTVEDALAMESECKYALGASIFTANPAAAHRLAAQLRAGAVTVNDVILPTSHPATPFGGRGDSGWGVTQGAEGLLEMTVPQVVSIRGGSFRPHYDMSDPKKLENQGELLRGFLEAGHAPGFARKLRGWWRVVRAAMRGV